MNESRNKVCLKKSKKKPQKAEKNKMTEKNKVKKRKTRVTREYQENEKEVQRLLEQMNLSLNISSATTTPTKERLKRDNLSQSIEFFCKSSDDTSKSSNKNSQRTKTWEKELEMVDEKTEEEQRTTEEESSRTGDDENDDDEECEVESSISALASVTCSTRPTNTAASFVHIELEDEPVIKAQRVKEKLSLNPDLLYSPKRFLDNTEKFIGRDAPRLKANTARLVNRFCEENEDDEKQFSEIVKYLMQDAPIQDGGDKRIYRTLCDHTFHPVFCEPRDEAVALPTRTFIKLHLKELRFTEHEMLQPEHRLANLLSDYYETYTERLKRKMCDKLNASLHTERKIINDLLQREAAATAKQDTDTRTQERRTAILAEHLQTVQEQRNELYRTEAEQKRLLRQILKTWMQLKKLREEQAYQCTRLRLRIHVREEELLKDARRVWQQRYENDLNEIMREELQAYYRAKRKWNRQQHHHSSENDAEEPAKKPKKPNVEKLARVLKRQLVESIGQPGEPKIDIFCSLLNDEEFHDLSSSAWSWVQRSRGHSYFMKLFFDGQFVGMTRSYRLEPDLSLSINETIGIFIERRLPKDIKVALYDKTRVPKLPFKIANIIVPLPLGSDFDEFQNQRVSFSSHKQTISGRLQLRFECEDSIYPDDMVKVLFPPPKERTKIPSDMLRKWHTENLKPQHHASKISKVTDIEARDNDDGDGDNVEDEKRTEMHRSRLETCTFQEDLLKFCSVEELTNNRRFRVLFSRYRKQDPSTRDIRFVPALENELACDDTDEPEEPVIDAGNWMDPIDIHKHEGKKYLKTLYEAIRNQCARLSKIIESSENLLIGNETNTIGAFLESLSSFFSTRHPLNPSRNKNIPSSQSPRTLEAISVNQNFNIILNVVRATGIPVRRARPNNETDSRQRSSSSTGNPSIFMPPQTFKYSNVRPFIAISYRDQFCRSMTAEGSNPTWNEELQLQFNASLADLRDDIKISLFDEVIENHINDDVTSRNVADVYQRIQTNWLGEYRIPISTLLKHIKFEGVCELNTPKVLLGYQRPSFDGSFPSGTDTTIVMEQMPEIKESIHLWFYIALAPVLDLPSLSIICLECSELREVRQHLHEWCLNAKEIQPKRFIDPYVCTVDGNRVCITRLLEAIPLPMEKCENLLDRVCRYVSLLNVIKDNDTAAGFNGVWLNNQTLLDTTWGSPKDLGILLACFMLSMGISSEVVLCVAYPYGESAFVLYRYDHEPDLMLADPCTGLRYYVNDVFCPITKVHCIITQDNIYCNIQSETRIAMMNFNVYDSACWLPAFNKRNPAPLGGVHQVNYTYTQCFAISELRKNIERKIIKKINTWRPMRKTIWNRAFQMRLQSILADFETNPMFGGKNTENQEFKYGEQLAAEFPNYTLNGFTLNFSYSNLSSISERIKATGIHLNSNKDVEFSLAVNIYPYTNNILSIWIFLISLTPNDK